MKDLSSTARQIIFWLLIVAGAVLIYKLVNPGSKNSQNIDLVELYKKIDTAELKQITVKATETVTISGSNNTEYHVQMTNKPAKTDLMKYDRKNGTTGTARLA